MVYTYPPSIVFVNNPVVLTVDTEGSTDLVEINVKIGPLDDFRAFSLSGIPVNGIVRFDLSDLLRPFVKPIQERNTLISSGSAGSTYSVYLSTLAAGVLAEQWLFSGTFFDGGVSKKMLLFLNDRNIDIFSFKFLNPNSNVIFSTRSATGVIRLYREEVGSIFFLAPTTEELFLRSEYGDVLSLGSYPVGTPLMVKLSDIDAAWHSRVIRLSTASFTLAEFHIKDIKSKRKYLLKFRNSYGVFERLLITGEASENVSFVSENVEYMKYAPALYDFQKARRRVPYEKSLKVQTGYKSPEELMFLVDLLASNEIYWIDNSGDEVACLVDCENYERLYLQTTPESMELTIRFLDQDTNYTPELYLTQKAVEVITDNAMRGITDNTSQLVGTSIN